MPPIVWTYATPSQVVAGNSINPRTFSPPDDPKRRTHFDSGLHLRPGRIRAVERPLERGAPDLDPMVEPASGNRASRCVRRSPERRHGPESGGAGRREPPRLSASPSSRRRGRRRELAAPACPYPRPRRGQSWREVGRHGRSGLRGGVASRVRGHGLVALAVAGRGAHDERGQQQRRRGETKAREMNHPDPGGKGIGGARRPTATTARACRPRRARGRSRRRTGS